MAIEGAIRLDDPRIPRVTSLDGVLTHGIKDGKTVVIPSAMLTQYQMWLDAGNEGTEEDYLAWLQKPATDAATLIEDKIETLDAAIQQEEQRELAEGVRLSNEQSRVDAEALRVSAENEREAAELTRQSSESERNEAEGLRVNAESLRTTAESSRELAESLRVDAEILRQTNTQIAITSAEDATENANTAAQNADDARDNIMPSVLNNEKVQADVYAQLNARITALEAILTNKIKDRIDVTKEFNVWGKTNLILYGSGASTNAPDFIGQTYIDTANSNVYIAVGTSNAGNWKLV